MQKGSMNTLLDSEINDMINGLQGESPRIRAGYAITMGEYRIQKFVDALIKTLDDEDAMVVGAAARSLGEIGDECAVPKLISTLDRFKNSNEMFKVERYAYGVLTKTIVYKTQSDDANLGIDTSDKEGKKIADAVTKVAQELDFELQKLGSRVHYEIMNALAKLGDYRAVTAIADLLSFPSEDPMPGYCEDSAISLSKLIDTMPNTETTLNAIQALEQQLISVSKERRSSIKYSWETANNQVRETLKAVIRKKRAIRKELNRSTGSLWERVFNRHC